MKQITYGVAGLIDWNAVLIAGKAKVHVHFRDGAITKYGVVPAEYTTDDPLIQRVIENSTYFKSGKIHKIRETVINTEAKSTGCRYDKYNQGI